MKTKILLLLLPLALASIEIQINSDYLDDTPHVKVDYNGNSTDIVSDKDTKSFGFDSNTLLSAIEKYFYKRPSDVFLRSPTPPFGDLYKQYGWNQVQRTLRPISVKVLPVKSKPIALLKELFENNSSKAATFDVKLSQTVEDTVSSRWSKKKEIAFDAKASYSYNFVTSRGGASTRFEYNAVWGEDYEKTRTVSIAASYSVQTTLDPGESVLVLLSATQTTVKIEVEYESTLSGDLVLNYQLPYRSHHFWSMDVNKVCKAGGLNNQVYAKEVISLNYFWNGEVHIQDRASLNKLIYEIV